MLIGLVGLSESGKSTAAKYLVDHYGYEEMSFARPLKEAAKGFFGLTDNHVYTQEGKAQEVVLGHIQLWAGLKEMFGFTDKDIVDNTYFDVFDASVFEISEIFVKRGSTKFRRKMKVREILQILGTEVGRGVFGDDFWVKSLGLRLQDTSAIVISDCRFPNEADFIRSKGGLVIGIDRPGIEIDDHPSELQMVENWDTMVDVTISNSSSLEALYATLQSAIETKT